ncbi:MAG: hypothetical protein HY672_00895 [Chloroflexi bacterium]|nr:hypothetical protein [Chloroflexota bacterium]
MQMRKWLKVMDENVLHSLEFVLTTFFVAVGGISLAGELADNGKDPTLLLLATILLAVILPVRFVIGLLVQNLGLHKQERG